MDLILNVMQLAEHYGTEKLFQICDQYLVNKIQAENCAVIYQNTRHFETAKVKNVALDCIIE
jgi:hypothetical protein